MQKWLNRDVYTRILTFVAIHFTTDPMLDSKKTTLAKSYPRLERNNKKLHLPLDHALADRLCLRFRLALEAAIQGRADLTTTQCLLEVTLLTSFVGEDGFSLIDEQITDDAETALYQSLERATNTRNIVLNAKTLENLTIIVNEHDRQLRELRLEVLLKASARLERLIQSGK